MPWLARLLAYISDICYDLYYLCRSIAWEVREIPLVGEALFDLFMNMREFFWGLREHFNDAADEVHNWWDWICEIASDLEDLAYDVYIWLVEKINAVRNLADDAWDMASDAWYYISQVIIDLPATFGFTFSTVFDVVKMFVGTIGTTVPDFVAWVKENAEAIYQTIHNYVTNVYETIYNTYETIKQYFYEYITNVYETIKNYITNIYQTFTEIFNTYVTNIIGASEEWVTDKINAFLQPFLAPINLINLFFNEINAFFSNPKEYIISRLEDIVDSDEHPLLTIFDKVMNALWR